MINEIEIDLDGFKIAALRTANRKSTGLSDNQCKDKMPNKIICVHGWLDNANSFLPLLPLIDNADIVAIDLPGHGHSDHQDEIYTIAAQSHILLRIADALNWNNFSLTGHSLGGCITPFSAVAAAERIDNLILIEAAGPRAEPPAALPARLKNFHQDLLRPEKFQSRLFENVDQAIASRLRANKMNHESAKLIVERQLKHIEHDDGPRLQWRFDSKLRQTSPSYFTEEQVQEVLKSINCPVLSVIARDGYLANRVETKKRLNQISACKVVELPGYHHLHLDEPKAMAAEINTFLDQNNK